MTSGALIPLGEATLHPEQAQRRPNYLCDCGHVLRVVGGGRHRVYFELSDSRSDNPVMDGICPVCGHGLPGKNRP